MTNLPGYYNLLILPYVAEASVVLANAFDARSAFNFWEPVRQHGVNTLWFVPTIMSILMEMDRASVGESLCRDQVRLALVGTAPLADQLRHDFESRYGITVYENYALSETLFITTNAPSRTVLDGSVGRSLPEVQVRIIDEAGDPLASGEEGEICVQTPVLFIGYHDPAREQPDLFRRDDWFPAGDVGILSPEGDLFVTGRKEGSDYPRWHQHKPRNDRERTISTSGRDRVRGSWNSPRSLRRRCSGGGKVVRGI